MATARLVHGAVIEDAASSSIPPRRYRVGKLLGKVSSRLCGSIP
jgi:hypothetical protein